jgi:hypothetical protein
MSLGEAIERLGVLYKREGRAKVDAATAVSAWGYGSLNGASLRVLSALRQYGLLDGGNDDVRVSELGLTVLLEPETSPEYTDALNAALVAPALFREMLTEYGNDLPSDPALVSYLVRKQEFGEQAARALIDNFRASVEYLRQRTASYHTEKTTSNAIDIRRDEEPANVIQIKELDKKSLTSERIFTHNIAGATVVEVRISGRLPNTRNVRRLLNWLDVVKDEIQAAAEEAEEAEVAENADFTVQ